MTDRQEVLDYGMTLLGAYIDTPRLDDSIPDDEVKRMIAESYDLVVGKR